MSHKVLDTSYLRRKRNVKGKRSVYAVVEFYMEDHGLQSDVFRDKIPDIKEAESYREMLLGMVEHNFNPQMLQVIQYDPEG